MLLFARVVEQGSFSAAARELNHSPSAVSKQMGALEDRIGLRLLHRTQQGISLTAEGKLFYSRCAQVAQTVGDAERMLESLASHPSGTLRVSVTYAFGRTQLLPTLQTFLARNPDLKVELELTDDSDYPFDDTTDVAIRFSEQIDNPDLIARKLAPNRRVICAAPSYIAANGRPMTPADLGRFNCLRLSTVEQWNAWDFQTGESPHQVEVSGNFEANTADAVYHAVLAGLGIARLSTYLVHQDLAAGRLVRLLPEYEQTSSALFAVYPERRNLAPKVRVFVDYLVECFSGIPPWDEATTQALKAS